MIKPVEVKAIEKYKLFVKYSDGVEGEISLSHLKADQNYSFLDDWEFFSNQVCIDERTNDIIWKGKPGLCKNAIYKQLELKCLMRRLKIDLEKI